MASGLFCTSFSQDSAGPVSSLYKEELFLSFLHCVTAFFTSLHSGRWKEAKNVKSLLLYSKLLPIQVGLLLSTSQYKRKK